MKVERLINGLIRVEDPRSGLVGLYVVNGHSARGDVCSRGGFNSYQFREAARAFARSNYVKAGE